VKVLIKKKLTILWYNDYKKWQRNVNNQAVMKKEGTK